MANAKKSVKFHFEQDDDYRLLPVNGVWGGVSPRGDIQADFFYESYTIPDEVTQAVAPDGSLGEELERKQSALLQRTILVGMMLTADQAESIGRWLQEKALEHRRLARAKGDTDSERDTVTTH